MAKIGSGSYDLNKWLHGGYEKDIVSVIYGAPGTGKTNFCVLAAVSAAKKGKKVVFVDTEGGFSVERVRQIVGDKLDHREVLKNIFLLKPVNFKEQKEAFKELLRHLKGHVDLVVVDGMTILYRLDFADAREIDEGNGEDGKEGSKEMQKINSELARQIKTLAEIARKREIPVIVTSQVYSWDNEIRMVGGDILKYWGKCLIELENDKGTRRALLRKHRSLPEKSLVFQIYDGGIRRRGWI